MTKRLLSWLLVLALLVGVCVTALADEPPIYDGGGCAHFYSIPKGPRKPVYTCCDSSYHYKKVTQLMKCEYCASTVTVTVEATQSEPHSWVILSKEEVDDRYHIVKKCRYCDKLLDGYVNK